MPTVAERLLRQLQRAGPHDDDQLAHALGIRRQQINQAARTLEKRGIVKRTLGPDHKLINVLALGTEVDAELQPASPPVVELMSEDEVKEAMSTYLEHRGYSVDVRWGRDRGIDIVATGPEGRLVIEAKGAVSRPAQQQNYFLGALGELIQRMDTADARYGLALPDRPQYRGLVNRLPQHARDLMRLLVFFVKADGTVEEL